MLVRPAVQTFFFFQSWDIQISNLQVNDNLGGGRH